MWEKILVKKKKFFPSLGCSGLNCMVGLGTTATSVNCSGDWTTMTAKLQSQLGADWVCHMTVLF